MTVLTVAELREREFAQERCPDCGAAVGDAHLDGCDVERCTVCHGQRLMCGCRRHDPEVACWIGVWPGVVTAVLRGWWSRFGDGGWTETSADDPAAMPDLNRVVLERLVKDGPR